MPQIFEQPWFSKIKRPSRYLGGEIHSVKKDLFSVKLRFALAFPDVYEVGMSHLGLRILYHILNQIPWVWAERVFAPWPDMEQELRKRKIPLWGLESGSPLTDFHVVGFSLQHELCYTNVLNMLDLGGIAIWSTERTQPFPLVIAGGPACFNPEPVAEFFDAIVIGDAEEVIVELANLVREAVESKIKHKGELLSELSKLPGLYIPSFFKSKYTKEGTVVEVEPIKPQYCQVRKAIVADINYPASPPSQIVPFTELVHDRLTIEITRGCGRGCRFCQAGMIYRPVREKRPQIVLKEAEQGIKKTGYEDISLLSLSSGDYTAIEPLLKALMDRQAKDMIALSLPSLRIDSLSSSLVEEIKRVRKTGFTLAVEAGSERLRRVINKGLTHQEILETAKLVYEAGWRLIKLYFMIGLPYERPNDIEELIEISRQLGALASRYGKKTGVNVSVATFVPKSHTPFMWSKQIGLEEASTIIQKIRNRLKGTRARVKWNQPELSWLEGIFSRGGRELAPTVFSAWEMGARFDAWGEHFALGIWEKALEKTGLNPHHYLRARHLNEPLPWDHIHTGVTKEYLAREWEKASTGALTPDCRSQCTKCGVCDHKEIRPLFLKLSEPFPSPNETTEPPPSIKHKYSVIYTKLGPLRYLSHLELSRTLIRAFRRAGLPLAYSEGFHPKPKISFASVLPVGMESMEEALYVEFIRHIDPETAKQMLNSELPNGIEVIHIQPLPPGRPKPKIKEITYEIFLPPGFGFSIKNLKESIRKGLICVSKTTKKGEERINLKDRIKEVRLLNGNRVVFTLSHKDGVYLRPKDIAMAILEMKDDEKYAISVRKIGQVLA